MMERSGVLLLLVMMCGVTLANHCTSSASCGPSACCRVGTSTPPSSPYSSSGHCTSTPSCGPSACCRVGQMRYSIPSCTPLGDLGHHCYYPGGSQDMTLHYPNGLQIKVEDAYLGMCPCRAGLECSRTSRTCQPPTRLAPEDNTLGIRH
ncbi:astakine isoform X1 [Procambarus clarkii]|uniref:astakine isoform X1 n=1 Tax=Procambarus clarkii TaxID=6728 RepID=UPI003743AB55